MSKAEDYRRNAELCQLAAEATREPAHKAAWLKMASDWLRMIRPEDSDPSPAQDCDYDPPKIARR